MPKVTSHELAKLLLEEADLPVVFDGLGEDIELSSVSQGVEPAMYLPVVVVELKKRRRTLDEPPVEMREIPE